MYSSYDTFVDPLHNPFYVPTYGVPEVEAPWETNDEANISVINALRDRIEKAEFKLNHWPNGLNAKEVVDWKMVQVGRLLRYNDLMNKARYN